MKVQKLRKAQAPKQPLLCCSVHPWCMCISIHAIPQCSVQFGSLPPRESGNGFGTDSEKVILLVGMDLLVHAELLYSIRLRSGLRQLRGHITENYKIPGAMADVVANDYSLLLFSLLSPQKNKLSVYIICWQS